MSLLRFTSRALFSSWFIAEGARNAVSPHAAAERLDPTIRKIVGSAKSFLPAEIAERIPEQTTTWVRITGAVQVLSGLGYAFGVARRPNAAVLAAMSALRLPSEATGVFRHRDDDAARTGLTTATAIFGAALLAAQDTEGKPGLVWRARFGVHNAAGRVQDATHQAVGSVQDAAQNAVDTVQQIAS